MNEIKCYDLSKYKRLVTAEGGSGRIRGTFAVLLSSSDCTSWVKAHDVVIYDEGHNSGRCLYSNDLTGSVIDGIATISEHMVTQSLLADVQEVWDEMLQVMLAAVDAARAAAPVSADDQKGTAHE